MINLKNITDSVKEPVKNLKHQAENLNQNIKEGSEDLNKKIHEGAEALDKGFRHPMDYNYLIFALPIVLILLAFIPMPVWLLQIVRFIITCCMGYVLFFEWRLTKKREKVFFISMALVILFNPLIPFYVPGMPINIITILAIGYLAYTTQQGKNYRTVHHNHAQHSTHHVAHHTKHGAHHAEPHVAHKSPATKEHNKPHHKS